MNKNTYPRRVPRGSLPADQQVWKRTQRGQRAPSFFMDGPAVEVPQVGRGSNFIPSLSVVRYPAELDVVEAMRRRVGKSLKGEGYWVTNADGLAIKALSQRRFIDLAREADASPKPSEMRDLAYSVRDDLAELLGDSPPGIAMPLGQVSRFGYKNNVLGVEPLGWKGHGARYAVHGEDGSVHPVGILAAEGQLTMDALTIYMGKVAPEFEATELATTPHLSICRRRTEIQDHDLRRARTMLEGEVEAEILLGDPVIYFRPTPDKAETEIIPVRPPQELAA